ncbi:MAG: peptidase A26 [Nanoarchaeota archaeon]|nr:peptidase A26 [Nanoarchaeota archaeon]
MYKKSQLRFIFSLILILLTSTILIYSFAGGDGSSGSPYRIANCSHLQNMSANLSANYQLNNSIDCSMTNSWNSGLGFKPVGNNSNRFTGNLYGNNYSISNLFINRSTTDYVGLFGYAHNTNSERVQDLNLINFRIIGKDYIGALMGMKHYYTIENIYVTSNVSGNDRVGGLIGYNYWGNIENAYATYVNVTGTNRVGGLVGEIQLASVNNSNSSGIVSGGYLVGGFTGGFGTGTISNSSSNALVIGTTNVGGFAGYIGGVDNCYATGDVYGVTNVGGFAGEAGWTSTIYSLGNVNGTSRVGGLIGYATWTNVENSYANGNVNGIKNVGGLVGSSFFNNGIIKDSYSTSNVSGVLVVGGLVGNNSLGTEINYSFSTGFVNGSTSVGGLLGLNTGTITSSYWDNETSGQTTSDGGFGRSTLEMYNQLTFVNWSSSIWTFTNTSYPELTWVYIPPQIINSTSTSISGILPFQAYSSVFISSLLIFLSFLILNRK